MLLISLLTLLTAAAPDPAVQRGERTAALAGCSSCHTAKGGAPYAGGYAIETSFGTFYGTNLTSDREHGVGGWTLEEFARAVQHGRGPQGTRYWPAFPFDSFTKLTDEDVSDLWAFLQTVPPSPTRNRPHDVNRPRWQLRYWRMLAFHPRGPVKPAAHRSESWLRGQYLVDAVGHCGGCHTPRSGIGRMRAGRYLQGTDEPPEPSPALHNLGWSAEDWTDFLELGMLPDGNFVGGEMSRIVEEGTAPLSAADRRAMASYLSDLP